MSVSSFSVDFTDRDVALEHFEEGAGPLTTGGTLSCMREDHIRYGVLLDVRSARGCSSTATARRRAREPTSPSATSAPAPTTALETPSGVPASTTHRPVARRHLVRWLAAA